MGRQYRDADWLERQYRERGMTQREIAEECGVSPRTIRTYMKRFGIERREVRGENHGLYGKERREEVKRKISDALTGRAYSEDTLERMSEAQSDRTVPETVREKISKSLQGITRPRETREKMSRSTAGERNPNWRGGYSERYGAGWSTARSRALERDGVCRNCGHDGSERRLAVHHIVPVRKFRESDELPLEAAHALDNLVVLCNRCHGRAEHGLIDVDIG